MSIKFIKHFNRTVTRLGEQEGPNQVQGVLSYLTICYCMGAWLCLQRQAKEQGKPGPQMPSPPPLSRAWVLTQITVDSYPNAAMVLFTSRRLVQKMAVLKTHIFYFLFFDLRSNNVMIIKIKVFLRSQPMQNTSTKLSFH